MYVTTFPQVVKELERLPNVGICGIGQRKRLIVFVSVQHRKIALVLKAIVIWIILSL
jgi:hypothetical protein